MVTPCKGIHKIICTRKNNGCPRKLKNVQPSCINCPDATTQILDLEDKILYEYRIEKIEKRKEKKGKKNNQQSAATGAGAAGQQSKRGE